MPIALDPEQTFEVVLKTDQSKPPESRPVFLFRHLTARQLRRIAKLGDDREALKASTVDKITDDLIATIGEALAGWRHIDREFSAESLDTICTIGELWELYYAMRSGGSLDVESKKNSDMPSPDSGEKSVEKVVQETPQNAETAQAK